MKNSITKFAVLKRFIAHYFLYYSFQQYNSHHQHLVLEKFKIKPKVRFLGQILNVA